MMTSLGHTVYHYGTEGSNPRCAENITVLSENTFNLVHGKYDYKNDGFLTDNKNPAYSEFILNAICQIKKRVQLGDFLVCSFGLDHKPIADAIIGIIPVELGIGYEHSFAKHRIWESYAWMHYIYGKENRILNPEIYDAVIPNYYDLTDFPYKMEKKDYFFFIGRPSPMKGLNIAVKTVELLGGKLIVAGQGGSPIKSPNVEFVGVVGIEERGRLMSEAKATFVPTRYIEPFGSVVVESLLCGTPIITTDFGAFPEINIHGKTGYRCRTLEQFVWAAKNIDKIDPAVCRTYAETNFSIERVGRMYEEYFQMLSDLYIPGGGWNKLNNERLELDWLNKIGAAPKE